MATVNRVIPLLVYEDIQAAHDFLVNAFGFEAGGVHRDPDGRVVHGEVGSPEGAIWLHPVAPEHELAPPKARRPATGGLVVHVTDVDEHFGNARAAGARIDSEPADQPYGQREYGARDPEGHRWWFATPLSREPE